MIARTKVFPAPAYVAIARRQRGMSLVELMIAVVLGLFLTWGAIQAFLSGKQAYSLQQSLSRIQENGRMAQEFIGFDIRNAGDYGCAAGDGFIRDGAENADNFQADAANPETDCATVGSVGINMVSRAVTETPTEFKWAVYGFNDVSAVADDAGSLGAYGLTLKPYPLAGSDVLLVHPTEDAGVITTSMGVGAATTFTMNINAGIAEDEYFAVSDCAATKIFQADSATATSVTINGTDNYCTYLTGPITGQSLAAGSGVREIKTYYYFVANNAAGRPALYRQAPGQATGDELLEGVENLQLEFGVDTNADQAVDDYQTANAVDAAAWSGWDWVTVTPTPPSTETRARDSSLVRAVRYSLLVRGEDSVMDEPQQYSFNSSTYYGGAATAATGDRRLRQIFTSTVGIRSRINTLN